jgi:hypothetical protein
MEIKGLGSLQKIHTVPMDDIDSGSEAVKQNTITFPYLAVHLTLM